ncbi:MAG: hypothetical protein ACKVI3_20335 [Verrucomicrobiia bacterium]
MNAIGMFDRKGALSLESFEGSGADFMPEGDGCLTALTNFRYIANPLWTTKDTVERINATTRSPPFRHLNNKPTQTTAPAGVIVFSCLFSIFYYPYIPCKALESRALHHNNRAQITHLFGKYLSY